MFDVLAAARRYKGPNAKKFEGLARSAVAIESQKRDVVQARRLAEMLEALDRPNAARPDAAQDIDQAAMGLALFTSAVVLYARGTKTASRARSTFALAAHLPEALRADHTAICNMRDLTVAHYGLGNDLKKPFNREALIWVQESDNSMSLKFVFARTNYRGAHNASILKLTAFAIPFYEDQFKKRTSDIFDLMEETPEIADAIGQAPFGAEQFFGTKERADVWSSGPAGTSQAWRTPTDGF